MQIIAIPGIANTIANRPVAPAVTNAAPEARPTTPPGTIWTGSSAGRAVAWTKDDIRAGNLSVKEFLAKELNAAEFQEGDELSANARVKSLVGGIMSVEYSWYADTQGAAHPDGGTAYKAFNLANPDKPVALTDMFAEKDVFKALMADPVIKKAVGRAHPRDLKALMKVFEDRITVDVGKGDDARPFYLDTHMLEHFSFDHVEGNTAYVRIGLGAGSGANRYDFTQLGIKLQIPAPLRASFQQADRAGTLGRTLNKIAPDKNMSVTFREAPATP